MDRLSDIYEYNRIAITYLKSDSAEEAFRLLKKAEEALKCRRIPIAHKLWGVTLNNLGCYYRRIQQPQKALLCFEKAAAYPAVTDKDRVNMAGVFLNISSVKDELGQHATSVSYAQKALHSMQSTLNKRRTGFLSNIRGQSRNAWVEPRSYTPLRFITGDRLTPMKHEYKYKHTHKLKTKARTNGKIFKTTRTVRKNTSQQEIAAIVIQRAWRKCRMKTNVDQRILKAQVNAKTAILELERLKKLKMDTGSAIPVPVKTNFHQIRFDL